MMSEKRQCWAGLDWSDKSHAVAVADAASGAEISRFEVPHSAEGLSALVAKLLECGTILGVAVETESNMAVIQLLQASIPVFHRVKTYYPQALAWFDDFTTQTSWDFILTFDNPEALRNAKKQKLIGFLKCHRENLTAERQQLIDNRNADSWPSDSPTIEAKSFLAVQICNQLRALQASLSAYRKRISELFEKHPKNSIFSSLPSAGPKLSPRLLSIFADNQKESPTIEALCGVVPVTSKSGNHSSIFFRRACNKFYRHTRRLFAGQTIIHCQWARAFYDSCRAKGQGHSLTLRNLSRKWINIIHAMSLTKPTLRRGQVPPCSHFSRQPHHLQYATSFSSERNPFT